jgi:outer membrane protein assembly factor BamB
MEKSFRDNLKFTDIDARVVGWRDGILVSTYDGKLRYLRKDGSTIWEFGSGGARSPLLGDGDVLFFPSSDGVVYALSGNTGKEIWNFPLHRGIPTGLALVTRNQRKVLIVAGSEESVYVVDAVTGRQLGVTALGRGSGSYAPIVADPESGDFYVLSQHSRIHGYHLNL